MTENTDPQKPDPHNPGPLRNKEPSPEQKNITQIYSAFSASVILQFLPFKVAQGFGAVLLLVVLVWAYILRGKANEDSLSWNHMTYLIRTIWIAGLILSIGVVTGGYYLYFTGDNTAIQIIVNNVMSGVVMTEKEVMDLLNVYFQDNIWLVIGTGVVTCGPGVLYTVYRLAKGLSRSLKGHRIGDPKAWL